MYALNTLQYSKRLIAVGFTSEQAEVQAECLSEVFNEELENRVCTKEDLQKINHNLENQIRNVKTEVQESNHKLENQIKDVKIEVQESNHKLENQIKDVKTEVQEVKVDL